MKLYSSLILIIGLILALTARTLGLTGRTRVRARTKAKQMILFAPSDDSSLSAIKGLQRAHRLVQQVFYLTNYSPEQPCLLIRNRMVCPATEVSPFIIDKLNELENGMSGLTLLELQPKRYASVTLPGESYLARYINTWRAVRCLINWGCYNAAVFYTSTKVIAIADPELFEKTL